MARDAIERPMIGALLRMPFDRVNLAVNRALAAAGHADIRPAHQRVFQHLPADGARLTELADRAQIAKQSMQYLVDDLVAHGYLERAPDPGDRRATLIRRTARGWEVERDARRGIAELEARWAARLGPERLTQLRGLLADLAAIADEDD